MTNENLQGDSTPVEIVSEAGIETPVAESILTLPAVQADDGMLKAIIERAQRPVQTPQPFNIYKVPQIEPKSFPDLNIAGGIKGTIANVRHLLRSYGITVRYNVITKKLLISVPGSRGASDNFDNSAMTQLISLAALNSVSSSQLPSFVAVIGDRNQFNPVADWISSKPWDGKDRLDDICDTLTHREDFPRELKQQLIHRWLISAVAAVLKPSDFRARGVLTLQGPQSSGKTSWISSLVPDQILRESVVKLDHHLDASSKDSLILAVSHWIVEIGELDSSFKKDVARLKGFLTGTSDKVRLPYARTASEYPRRTVFAATVNETEFLVDPTGNTRWWTIPVTHVNFKHGIDMQQVFAQMAVDFHRGEQWWLTKAEEECLESMNKEHRSVSVIRERVLQAIDLKRVNEEKLPAMSTIELMLHAGIKSPTNAQCKECTGILREYLGASKKINGIQKWRIPLREVKLTDVTPGCDDDSML